MKGPPAFPHSHLGINRGQLSYEDSDYEDGMSLRDYFAAKAIQGRMAKDKPIGYWREYVEMEAALAYEVADAMLEARKE